MEMANWSLDGLDGYHGDGGRRHHHSPLFAGLLTFCDFPLDAIFFGGAGRIATSWCCVRFCCTAM